MVRFGAVGIQDNSHSPLMKPGADLQEAVVSQQQGMVVDAEVEDAVMAACNTDALAGSDDADALALLHPQEAAHGAHHDGAVTAAGDGGILQGRQDVDGGVVAVRYANDAHRELILPTSDRRLHNPLYLRDLPCIPAAIISTLFAVHFYQA